MLSSFFLSLSLIARVSFLPIYLFTPFDDDDVMCGVHVKCMWCMCEYTMRLLWHDWQYSDKAPSEATFRGSEFLSYDLGQTGGEPIVSAQDAISLYFRTRQPNGLLFYTSK